MKQKFYSTVSSVMIADAVMALFEKGTGHVYAFLGHLAPFYRRMPVSGVLRGATTTITAPAHGLSTGDEVLLSNIEGTYELNGWNGTVTVNDADTFTIPADTTLSGDYTGGGLVLQKTEQPPAVGDADVSQVIKNIAVLQKIPRTHVMHGLSRRDWYSRKYAAGDYVNIGMDTYFCVSPGAGDSTEQPVAEHSKTVTMADGYQWKLVYSPTADEIARFGHIHHVVPVGRIYQKDEMTTRWKSRFDTVGGQILSVALTDAGSGYVNPADVEVRIIGDGVGAKASVATITGGVITEISIDEPGAGYTWAEVSLFDKTGNGSGARAKVSRSPLRGTGFDVVSELVPQWLLLEARVGRPDCANKFPAGFSFRQAGVIINLTNNGTPVEDNCMIVADTLKIKNQAGHLKDGAEIVGQTSGQTAVVMKTAGNDVFINVPTGNFAVGETIVSPTGTAEVVKHEPGTYNGLWGDLLYLSETEPVIHHDLTTESMLVGVKVI